MLKSEKSMIWAIGCLAALFVACGICGGTAYFFKDPFFSSRGASEVAKAYLKDHPVVRSEIGEIRDFGKFPGASYQYTNGAGEARLVYSLKGTLAEGRATLRLVKPKGKDWAVAAARLEVKDKSFTLMEGDLETPEPSPFPPLPPAPPPPPEDPGTKT